MSVGNPPVSESPCLWGWASRTGRDRNTLHEASVGAGGAVPRLDSPAASGWLTCTSRSVLKEALHTGQELLCSAHASAHEKCMLTCLQPSMCARVSSVVMGIRHTTHLSDTKRRSAGPGGEGGGRPGLCGDAPSLPPPLLWLEAAPPEAPVLPCWEPPEPPLS